MCGAPYQARLTSYPYSTASGGVAPLPVLLSAHEAVNACDAFELVSAVTRRCVSLDERRTASELAHIAGFTSLLSTLPPLLDYHIHAQSAYYQQQLAEYGRGLSPPHAAYLRAQRRRRALRWAADERLQSPEQCVARIERLLECFSRALHSSPCEYLFSRQPSSADVMLAAYTAFLALAPHDDGAAATATAAATASRTATSARSVPASSLPFVPLSSLLSSHPLLLAHSRLMFDRFFPAFAFHSLPPRAHPPTSAPPPPAAYASDAAVSQYVTRSSVDAGRAKESDERVGGVSGAELLSELRARLSERPVPRKAYTAPPLLPVRGGDQWVEQAKAALTAEEHERSAQRSRRMWLLGGAALVLAFVLWQRGKAGAAAATAAPGETAALSGDT